MQVNTLFNKSAAQKSSHN